ncbi:MAG: exodeoxyribonuclease VII large subunit, partial [Nitriliruptoraceae bacterium]
RTTVQLTELVGSRLRRETATLGRQTGTLAAAAARAAVPAQRQRLAVLDAQLRAADPAVQLARGYSITFDDRGEVVRSVHTTPPGARIRTRLVDGELLSRVDARTASTEMRSDEGERGREGRP